MLGNILNRLKGTAGSLATSALSSSDKDVMEAMVAAATITAFADGDCSDEEVTVITNILDTSDQLEAFGDEPAELFEKYCKTMEASARMGKNKLMKEIKDVVGDEENAIRVLIMAIEVADSDNNIDEDEMKVLKAIATTLNLNLNDHI